MPQQSETQTLGNRLEISLASNAQRQDRPIPLRQHIEESIYLILSTAKGERVMLPEFGCGIHDQVFAPNNSTTLAIVTHLVREALVAYEPRIDLIDVAVETAAEQPNLLLIRVDYRIRATNSMGNLVYPFYITEGR